MTTATAPPELEAGVLEAIDAIRPALQADGGDIVFKRIDDDGVVFVELVGACGTCPVSTMTLKAGVERIIMARVPGITAVEEDTGATSRSWSMRSAAATGARSPGRSRWSRAAARRPKRHRPRCSPSPAGPTRSA